MENEAKCPYCKSTSLTANKQGFGAGKALTGVILTGGIGALAGTIGSNKVIISCLNCSKQFTLAEKAAMDRSNLIKEAKKARYDKMTESEKEDYNESLKRRQQITIAIIVLAFVIIACLMA